MKLFHYKTKHLFLGALKFCVFTLLAWYMYHLASQRGELDLELVFQTFFTKEQGYLPFLLLFFTSINWMLEIKKWQLLTRSLKKISFIESFKQTLIGNSISIFTPNRIGDYGVKALFYDPEYRKKILCMNLAGNLFQLLTTFFFGIVGILITLLFFQSLFLPVWKHFSISTSIYVSIVGITIIALLISWKKNLLKTYFLKPLQTVTKKVGFKIMGVSIARYIVFSHQLIFLLLVADIQLSYIEIATGVFLYYAISSCVPTIFWGDAVVKSGVAVVLFSAYLAPSYLIGISFMMWLYNFIVPAIIGGFLFLRTKIEWSSKTQINLS